MTTSRFLTIFSPWARLFHHGRFLLSTEVIRAVPPKFCRLEFIFFLSYRNSWKTFKVIFYHFLLCIIHCSCVCFNIFAGDLISVIYPFCPDLKSLFTVAAIS